MKNITLFLIVVINVFNHLYSQNTLSKTEDLGRVAVTPIIPDQLSELTDNAKHLLFTKLEQIATENGLGAGNLNPRFIITARVNVLSKDIIAGPPAMIIQNFDVTFFIADHIDQKIFASKNVSLKGVSTNESKAFIEGLKLIKPQSSELKDFIANGKIKIIEYYNTQCDFILKAAQALVSQQKYEEAIFTLTSIPEVCKSCYDKAMDAIGPIHKLYIDHLCDKNFARAKSVWVSSMDERGAKLAANYLSDIYPEAKCYQEAQKLSKEIASRMKELWKFELKKYDNQYTLEQMRIRAYRDVGVAFGNNQKSNSYNTQFIFR